MSLRSLAKRPKPAPVPTGLTRYATRKEALAQVTQSVQAISEQNQQSGGYSCLVGTMPDLAKYIGGLHEPACHEIIHPGRPCHLFFDIDADTELLPAQQAEFVRVFSEAVASEFAARFPKSPPLAGPPACFSACRFQKTSFHLVWDVAFSSPTAVLHFIQPIAEKKLFGLGVDQGVYGKGRATMTLRLPYCFKFVEGQAVGRVMPWPARPSRDFDLATFYSGLVHYYEGVSAQPAPVDGGMAQAAPAPQGDECPTNPEAAAVLGWLSEAYPFVGEPSVKCYTTGKFEIHAPFFCSVANKWHAKNYAYINGDDRGNVGVRCLDGDCGNVLVKLPFTTHDFSPLPNPIDWTLLVATASRAKS